MEKVTFGIVGCGRIGTRHADHIKNSGALLAVCDTDADKANVLAAKYDARLL